MSTITPRTTLAEVVTAHPSLARELERRDLDYCCGGGRTIEEASAATGLDADWVVSELLAATTTEPEPAWATMGPAELVDHLEATHHRYLWDELPRLSALADKVRSVHGERHPELAEVALTYEQLRGELEPHLLKEERVLFPMVRQLVAATGPISFHCGGLRNPIAVMLAEHDAAGELLHHLRLVTDGYTVPADGCASYEALYRGLEALEADTHLHIHKENNLLFPQVVAAEDAG